MSSRFATNVWCSRRTTSLILAAGSGLAAHEWPHGEKAATDFTATTLPANMSRRQLVRRVKQRWRTERVYEDAKESLGWITTRASFAAGTTCVHGAGLLRVIVAERSRAFPPRPEKLPRGRSHRHDGADGNRPERTSGIPSSLCAWPSRASCHMVTRCPCVTDRDRWDRLVHMP